MRVERVREFIDTTAEIQRYNSNKIQKKEYTVDLSDYCDMLIWYAYWRG